MKLATSARLLAAALSGVLVAGAAGIAQAAPPINGTITSVVDAATGFSAVSNQRASTTTVTVTVNPAVDLPKEAYTLTFAPPNSGTPIQATITAASGTSVTATASFTTAPPGSYAVTLTNGAPDALEETWTCTCFTVSGGTPTITGFFSGGSALSQRGIGAANLTGVELRGTNLAQGTRVSISGPGVTFTPTAYASTKLTGTLAIDAGTATAGPRDILVTNTDGATAPCQGCLVVTARPIVATIVPNQLGQGAGNRTLTLTGSGFQTNMTVKLTNGANTLGPATATVTNSGSATVPFTVAASTATGSWTAELTNADAGTSTAAAVFTTTASPAITGFTPTSIQASATNVNFTFTDSGNTVKATDPSGFAFSPPDGITINSYTAATRTLNVSVARTAPTTARSLVVTNPDGGTATFSNVLTIAAPPAVTGIVPGAVGRGGSRTGVTISGGGFDNSNGTSGVTVTIAGVQFDVTSVTTTSIVGSLAVPADASLGTRDVTVVNVSKPELKGNATCTGCFAVDSFSPNTITPSGRPNNALYTLKIAGGAIPADAEARLMRSPTVHGQGDIVGTNASVNEARTEYTGTFDLRDVAPGTYVVRLVSPTEGTGTCACTFTVIPWADTTITSVAPSSLPQGASNRTLTITGTNFTKGAVVSFDNGVTAAGQTTFVNNTTLTVAVNVPAGANAAATKVIVTIPSGTPSGTAVERADVFAVTKAPAITAGTTNIKRGQGAATANVEINGTDFQNGATVTVGGEGVTVGTPTVTATKITVPVTVASGAAPGVRQLSVTNPDGGVGTCATCFTVTPAPGPTSTNPAFGGQGRTVNVSITGVDFQATPAPTVSFGDGIVVTNVVVPSATTITATLNISSGALLGTRPVTITNGDGGVGTCLCTFRVNAVPTVTSVTPNSYGAGALEEPVTIKGTQFADGAALSMPNATFSDVDVVDAETITAKITLSSGTSGARAVTVTNDDGEANACAGTCFSIAPGPSISSVTPNNRGVGAPATGVDIDGSNFNSPTLIVGDGLTVSGTPTSTTTRLIAQIAVSPSAAPGARTLVVRNPDRGRATALFTVNPLPAITSISPDKLGAGNSGISVTLNGTGFNGLPAVSFGPDTTVTNVARPSATQVTLTLAVGAAAARGPRDVTFGNGDGSSITCDDCVSIVSAPTISGITPASRGQGAPSTTMTITGTAFAGGATVSAPNGSGLTFGTPTVVNATTVTVPVSVASDAPLGAKTITVTNSDGGAASSSVFTVTAKPSVTGSSLANAQRGRAGRTTTLTGTGFVPGPVTVSLGTGITVTAANASSPTTVSVTFDIADSAPLGPHDVSVTNPDGGTGVCAGCFTVIAPRALTIAGAPAKPVSGETYSITVTAHQTTDPASPTDSSYTGTPIAFAQGDGHFAGSCTPATGGISNCQIEFGDLGPATLTVEGTGPDGDLGGTSAAVVQPVALTFEDAPISADRNQTIEFTVSPVAGRPGATVNEYAATRTLTTTGGSTPATGTVLTCPTAVCTFTLKFTSSGTKTVKVSDNSTPSVSTPTATITIKAPTAIAADASAGTVNSGQTITFRGVLTNLDTGGPVGGASVALYARTAPDTVLRHVRTVTTDSFGRYATTFRIDRNTVLQARYPGNSQLSPSSSPTRTVLARTIVRVTSPASGSSIRYGTTLVVRGYTVPRAPGSFMSLRWRRSDGRIVELSRVRALSDGSFRFAKGGLARGTYTLFVVGGATATNVSGQSGTFTIKVV